MNRFQRADVNKTPNLHVVELTSRQLIFLLCGMVLALTTAFGVGIFVARIDTSFENAPAKTAGGKPVEQEVYSMPASNGQQSEGSKEPQDALTKGVAQRSPEVPKPRGPYMDRTPRMTSLDPLPAQQPHPIQVEAPSRTPRPDSEPTPLEGEVAANGTVPATQPTAVTLSATESQPVPAPQPVATSQSPVTPQPVPAPQPALTPQPVPAPVPQLTPAPQPAPASQKEALLTPITPEEPFLEPFEPEAAPAPVQVAAVPGPGKFGIQLVAISGAERQAHAEALRQKLLKDSGVYAEVVPSPDGLHYRVIVTGFDSQASANGALNEIRTKTGFKDAFVKAL